MRANRFATQEAVTPVIGSVLVLGITVLGVAGIMLWGAPAIQQIQDQNAQLAMVGEMEDLRLASLALSVPDAARTPTIVLLEGTFTLQGGSSFLLTSDHDAANTACDWRVTGWHASPVTDVTITTTGCRSLTTTCPGDACIEAFKVSGSNLVEYPVILTGSAPSYTLTVSGADLTQDNWLFQASNGVDTSLEVYMESWLLRTDRYAWDMSSSVGSRSVYFEGGAVFSKIDNAYFLESDPAVSEDAFATGDYVVSLRTLDASSERSFTGRDSHTVLLRLLGTYSRVDHTATHTIRYDIHGDLSEAWCTSLLDRNRHLTGDPYTSTDCTAEVPSVKYTTGAAFRYELLHANIRTSLEL